MASIVIRLSDQERMVLKLLTAALTVSEYTDDVDNIRSYRREDNMEKAMTELFVAVAGLSLAAGDIPAETKDILKKSGGKCGMTAFEPMLQNAFEVGRRFKRLNPDKMRGEYGKMLMLMQDASPGRMNNLGLESISVPIHTVSSALESIQCGALLKDAQLAKAVKVRCSPAELQEKNASIEALIAKYGAEDSEKKEVVERCIRSIADVDDFIAINLHPIRKLMKWLEEDFKEESSGMSLRIGSGRGGSCLTHSHQQQHQYVMESLTLWEIIHRDIFDFWECVEKDMIGASRYRFANTGQGYNRVCSAPNTGARMSSALSEAHNRMGGWVGIKVVHLGDQDVPNALVFIDKYTVIPSLLSPIVQTIETLEHIYDETLEETHPGVRNLMKSKYGSLQELRTSILQDFFKHAFDGSGDDGGNCIDGRLTSAWNWCSLLHKKSYYDAFVLTGFNGFDTV